MRRTVASPSGPPPPITGVLWHSAHDCLLNSGPSPPDTVNEVLNKRSPRASGVWEVTALDRACQSSSPAVATVTATARATLGPR